MNVTGHHATHPKVKEWLKRYVPAEVISLSSALILANIVFHYTDSTPFAAIAATWGENVGFFGTIIYRDVKESRKQHKLRDLKYNHRSFLKNMRNIVVEFSIPEILDTLVIRPLTMFFMIHQFGNLQIGVIAGKIAADIVYYIPLVIMYELRKKHLTDHF
jgi:hypothetical protein